MVVAAGNENADAADSQPANCDGVITVAATDREGNRAEYSNFGAATDIAAPGGETSTGLFDGILSTVNSGARSPSDETYAYYQGTSMATPQAAGVAALLLAKDPNLSPFGVETVLKATARPIPGLCLRNCGAGLVEASAAINSEIEVVVPE